MTGPRKLTPEDIEDIRDLWRLPNYTLSMLARRFKVSTTTINNVIDRTGAYARHDESMSEVGLAVFLTAMVEVFGGDSALRLARTIEQRRAAGEDWRL